MDKNTVIGFLLIFGLLIGYSFYTTKQNKKQQEKRLQEMEAVQDSISNAAAEEQTAVLVPQEEAQDSVATDSVAPTKPIVQHTFSYQNTDQTTDYVVNTNMGEYHFSPMGGYLTKVQLHHIYPYTPKEQTEKPELVLFDHNTTMNFDLKLKSQFVNTKECYFVASADSLQVTEGEQQLTLRLYPYKNEDSSLSAFSQIDSSAYLEYVYTFNANDYKFDFAIHFVNLAQYLYKNKREYNLKWEADINNVEKNYDYERDATTLYYSYDKDDVDNLNERAADTKDFTTSLKWVSFKQQFFTSIIIAKNAFKNGHLEVALPEKNERPLLKKMNANLAFEVENTDEGSFDMSLYFGPNQYKQLKPYDLGLERQVPLGWGFFLLHWINRYAIIPIFNWLEAYGLSYGIIILILTIIIKMVLLPIAYKTYMSSAKMRALKPQISEISERYPKQEDAMKKQQATMTLYKRAGVSPSAGCLPALLQMPILIAMFRFFPSAYELRQQPFLWADDLSTYDSILDLSFNIPFYGDHVSLFTLLMTIATLVYTWLNNKLMAPSGNEDQMKMMRIMMYLMPILFLGMFNSFSSALTYYYLLVNLITFLQMWIFRMAVDEKKLQAQLLSNMNKPIKKSKWELKMEAMMKQQQQLQKQQAQRKK